jgi:hypothetical protein
MIECCPPDRNLGKDKSWPVLHFKSGSRACVERQEDDNDVEMDNSTILLTDP